MIRELLKRFHMRVNVEGHGRSGVAETLGELDRADPLLVPEARSPVSERVGTEAAGVEHGRSETVATDAECELISQCLNEFLWYRNASPLALAFTRLSADTKMRIFGVILVERQRLADTQASKFHHQHGQHEIRAEAGE